MVQTRPPRRSRASSTITLRPAWESSRAAESPAAPAPITTASTFAPLPVTTLVPPRGHHSSRMLVGVIFAPVCDSETARTIGGGDGETQQSIRPSKCGRTRGGRRGYVYYGDSSRGDDEFRNADQTARSRAAARAGTHA